MLSLVALAGCGGVGLPPLPGNELRAFFPPGGVVDTIEIEAIDRLPLRKAELTTPDGPATASGPITVNPTPTETFYQPVTGGLYAGNSFGLPDLSAVGQPTTAAGAAPQTRSRLLTMISTASIALPDPVVYRRQWRKYRIRLVFGALPGEVETRSIAAPRPPPGQ